MNDSALYYLTKFCLILSANLHNSCVLVLLSIFYLLDNIDRSFLLILEIVAKRIKLLRYLHNDE